MTGNKSGRASVNHKAVNIMAQHRLATLRLPVRPGFAPSFAAPECACAYRPSRLVRVIAALDPRIRSEDMCDYP